MRTYPNRPMARPKSDEQLDYKVALNIAKGQYGGNEAQAILALNQFGLGNYKAAGFGVKKRSGYDGPPASTQNVVAKPSNIPKSWNDGSAAFKEWKKAYNAWYYKQHPEKWNTDKSPMSSTAKGYQNAAYRQAAEARAKAYSNSPRRSDSRFPARTNAMAALERSGQRRIEKPSFVEELKNSPLIKVGRGVLQEAKANKKKFNDMWAEGADMIAKAGKSFLSTWMAGR